MRFRATLAPEQVSHLYALIGPLSKVASSQRGQASSSLSQRTNGGGIQGGTPSFAGGNWIRGVGPSSSSSQDNTCLLSIDSEKLQLALDNLPQTAGMTCLATLQAKGGIFLEHRIESNAPDNRIVLRVDLQQFRVALQSIQQHIHKSNRSGNAGRTSSNNVLFTTGPTLLTVLKLAKTPHTNNLPCLCLEAKTAQRMEIHQMIPVQVQRPDAWQEHKLWPAYLPPSPAVHLSLSPATGLTLKALLDAVKQQSNASSGGKSTGGGGASVRHILLTGHAATAEMRLSCQHDNTGVQWQTILLGQVVPTEDENNQNHSPDENTNAASHTSAAAAAAATVCVDASQVACALHHGAWTTQWAWMPNVAFVVTVRLEPVGVCTYVLPVHYLEEMEEDNDDDDDNDDQVAVA